MKGKKNRQEVERSGRPAASMAVQPWRPRWWHYCFLAILFCLIAFEVYGPALNGAFLFDDSYLPFLIPGIESAPLKAWFGVRPLLMLSFWLNFKVWGVDPYPYHALNLLMHVVNSLLAGLIVRRFLTWVGETGMRRDLLALFAGGLFLIHPVQTESVAYVASRSEAMSILFFLSAFAVFIYRPQPAIGLIRALVVLLLFGIACSVKEHATVLPFLLLLTDYYFNPGFRIEGIKRNWKFYLPVFAGGAVGAIAVWRVLQASESAGFQLKAFTWYQYLFSQFRVIWLYIRLYVLPFGQNADYDLHASKTLFDDGSVFFLIGLMAAVVLAWKYRKRYPLASFGYLGFLILLAPTSSIVPIRDLAAERRLYLPFICLLLITVDFLRRWRVSTPALAAALGAVLIAEGALSYQRNQVWSGPLAFWQDALQKNPDNSRARFQLAYAQWQAGKCQDAVANYEIVGQKRAPDESLLVDWAHAYDCAQRPDDALAKLRQAALLSNSAHVQSQIGMIYGKRGQLQPALEALALAEKIDPHFDMTYVYRGNVYANSGDIAQAIAEYKRALTINPRNQTAKEALTLLNTRSRQR
jgi:tetratricopeptide (TPR) repeat protein